MPSDIETTLPRTSFLVEVRVAGTTETHAVVEALFSLGSFGVQEIGTELVTYLPNSLSREAIRNAVSTADALAHVAFLKAPPVDWSVSRAAVQLQRIGSLTVVPPWLSGGVDPATAVVIDPAMAFGTGEHATTRGVIRLMQGVVGETSIVADIGAGSGILSIAAAKLGARRVIAVELDADATTNAVANIRVNGVGDRVHYMEGDAFALLPLIAPVDIVLANILSSVLIELLPAIRDSLTPGGRAILSGILLDERMIMLDEILAEGWRAECEDVEEGWWAVLISRS